MRPLKYISFLLLMASCIMTKNVAVSVLSPSRIQISDSIKTVLVVNTSYDFPTFNDMERTVYDTVQTIAYRSYIDNLSKKYNVKFLFLEHTNINRDRAAQLCIKHNADLLVNMKKINMGIGTPIILSIIKTNEYTYYDENKNVVCAWCGCHYKPLNQSLVVATYIAPECPRCSCRDVVSESRDASYIKEIRNSLYCTIFNVETDWVIYDRYNNNYRRRNEFTRFSLNDSTLGEIFRISNNFNVILDKIIFPSYQLENKKLLYPLTDSTFRQSIKYVNDAEWDNAAEIWKSFLICPNNKLRKAACHNLSIYYEREGKKDLSEKYQQFEKGKDINLASSEKP